MTAAETILEPDLPIVDAHHHLWDRPGWRYLADDYLSDLGTGHNVVATVFVEALAMYRENGPAAFRSVGETEFASGLAGTYPLRPEAATRLCAGIVSNVDLRAGSELPDILQAHIVAGRGRLRGIRHVTAHDPDASLMNPLVPTSAGLMADDAFRHGLAALAPLGLGFDVWLYHPQMPELLDLARAFPDQRFCLDHLGGPLGAGRYAASHDDVFRAWSGSLRDLSACPNIVVKIGGLGIPVIGPQFTEGGRPLSSLQVAEIYQPYLDVCLEAFGPERCMFESNFPVDRAAYRYDVFWNACKRLTADLGRDEKAALFAGTAADYYRLDVHNFEKGLVDEVNRSH